MIRRGLPALLLVAALVGGCAGSDAGTPADIVDSTAEADVDLADVDLAEGAFVRNEGSRSDPQGSPITSDDATEPVDSGDDAAAPTSVDAGTTGGATTDGTTTGTTTGTGTSAGAGVAAPGQGIIFVGGAEYVFAASVCEFDAQSALVEGVGMSDEFGPFQASIYYGAEDFDADGRDDVTLDVIIEFEVPAGAQPNAFPELYASKVDSQTVTSGQDIVVTVEGEHIFGGGLMDDDNGVVFPVGEPGAMTFDARCS